METSQPVLLGSNIVKYSAITLMSKKVMYDQTIVLYICKKKKILIGFVDFFSLQKNYTH